MRQKTNQTNQQSITQQPFTINHALEHALIQHIVRGTIPSQEKDTRTKAQKDHHRENVVLPEHDKWLNQMNALAVQAYVAGGDYDALTTLNQLQEMWEAFDLGRYKALEGFKHINPASTPGHMKDDAELPFMTPYERVEASGTSYDELNQLMHEPIVTELVHEILIEYNQPVLAGFNGYTFKREASPSCDFILDPTTEAQSPRVISVITDNPACPIFSDTFDSGANTNGYRIGTVNTPHELRQFITNYELQMDLKRCYMHPALQFVLFATFWLDICHDQAFHIPSDTSTVRDNQNDMMNALFTP